MTRANKFEIIIRNGLDYLFEWELWPKCKDLHDYFTS